MLCFIILYYAILFVMLGGIPEKPRDNSQVVSIHAEADRLRRSGGRHHHCAAPWQQEVVGETHHSFGNWNLCKSGQEEQGMPVRWTFYSNFIIFFVFQ